ncbi:carbohydrate kinase [bacterium]|nr:carbohydrate kinase [bacterium]
MILVGGENLMDMIQTGSQNENALFEAVPGGSPYNLAMAIGRQGESVSYVTPISEDKNGDHLAAKLRGSHVLLSGSRVSAPTSLAMVSIEDGVPSYAFYREGTAERQIEIDKLSACLNDDISVFHIGSLGLTGGTDADIWEAFASLVKGKGVALSLDPNVRPSFISDSTSYRARIRRLMKMAAILKLSDEDLEWLYEGCEQNQALEKLVLDTEAKVLVLTKGGDGSAFYHEGVWHHAPSAPLKVLSDTVGAGDTFMASMLVWLKQNGHLRNMAELTLADKRDMQAYAAIAAAFNCERQGCNPPWANELS